MINLFAASTGTEVVVTILLAVAAIALSFVLYKSIKKEIVKYKAMSDKNLTLSPHELRSIIASDMGKSKCEYTLIEVSINGVENITKVCGEEQYRETLADMLKKVKNTLPTGVKIAILDDERVWLYIKHKIKKEALTHILRNLVQDINEPIVLIGSLTIEFDVNIAAVIYEKGLGDINKIAAHLELTAIMAKKLGNNKAVIFDRSIANTATEQYSLFAEIKQAIKNNDFRIFYQPLVGVRTQECYAVEAFLRWQHEIKGIISPEVFMPSLEHSGDINWVGLWAFENIAKQLEYWHMNNADVKIKVNTNWSISQLANTSLSDEVRKILKKYKVLPSDFFFEVTDYKTALSSETALKNLAVLRQIGIGIAIDNINLEIDTIVGLDKGAVNMIKFNRDFTAKIAAGNEGAKSVAEMVVKNATANNILVAGEGVEDEATLEKFRSLGISLAQGYYFSKPKAPAEAMASILMTPWKRSG